MLSKNKIKFIRSLDSKKERHDMGVFVAEGEKLVAEILNSPFIITYLAATNQWFEKNKKINLNSIPDKDIVTEDELHKISFLKTPNHVLCLVKLPSYPFNLLNISNKLSLLLDTVQDPGNLGTILRIADWFGIEDVICSTDTADAFNPKVVQSTMGAICRIKIHYKNLEEIAKEIQLLNFPIYGATLNGENIYGTNLTQSGFILMGNESKGISPQLLPYISKHLFIPFYPVDNKRSESLNVSVATAIICAEFRRQITN